MLPLGQSSGRADHPPLRMMQDSGARIQRSMEQLKILTQEEVIYMEMKNQTFPQSQAQHRILTRSQAQSVLQAQESDSKARDFLESFSFDGCKRGNQGFRRLLLQVFGFAGHGKSSFINTCKTVWDNGPYKNYTTASGSYRGDTTARRTYPLTDNIVMVDNRGCTAMRSHETGEIYAQLANLLPLDKEVTWSRGFSLANMIVEAEPVVRCSDFIAPIFVYSATFAPHPNEIQEIRKILKNCREMTGVEATVIITHRRKGNVTRAENMFRDMGITYIFSLENYTPQNMTQSPEVHQLVMRILYSAVSDAKFRVDYPRDPESEMRQRKVFMLNFIHKNDLKDFKRESKIKDLNESAALEKEKRRLEVEDRQQQIRDQEAHEERMRKMEEDYKRQMLQDQIEHKKKMEENQKKKKKPKRK